MGRNAIEVQTCFDILGLYEEGINYGRLVDEEGADRGERGWTAFKVDSASSVAVDDGEGVILNLTAQVKNMELYDT